MKIESDNGGFQPITLHVTMESPEDVLVLMAMLTHSPASSKEHIPQLMYRIPHADRTIAEGRLALVADELWRCVIKGCR